MIVWDGTAPGTETYVVGPGEPERTASPEVAASGSFIADEAIPAGAMAALDMTTGRAYLLPPGAKVEPRGRSYRPGEVEEIAVAAVVREALWGLIARRDPDEMPIEALVDEAAMAAGRVMARALGQG